MMNSVVLVGRLTKDADMRYTQEGTAVANFTLATQRPFKNQNGDYEADFIRVQVWRRPAENVANYTKKGSLVGVQGRMQTRSYENEGRTVYITEVVADRVQFLEPKGKNQGQGQSQNNQTNQGQQDNPFEPDDSLGPIDINDEDLPF